MRYARQLEEQLYHVASGAPVPVVEHRDVIVQPVVLETSSTMSLPDDDESQEQPTARNSWKRKLLEPRLWEAYSYGELKGYESQYATTKKSFTHRKLDMQEKFMLAKHFRDTGQDLRKPRV